MMITPATRRLSGAGALKFLRNMLLTVLVLLLILAGAGTWFIRRSWPQISGSTTVPGIAASVQVIRDQWGVPNIYAENERDLFIAQGYVHAQDRLWSMYFNRLTASGRLSEIVGEAGLRSDKILRTLGIRRAAEREWAAMNPAERALLQAYADGINAYVNAHRNRLPLEFTMLGYDPEPWTPVDSIAYGNLVSLTLSGNYRLEFLRARLIPEIGEQKTKELLPAYDPNTPLIVPEEVQSYQSMRGMDFAGLDALDALLGDAGAMWGSNNWVVSGNRTASGMPLLAGDTHLNLTIPSIWYMNGIHGGRFNSIGFTFPGVPAVVIGHNSSIAWAMTNLNPDSQDLYIEKLDDPNTPTRYEFQGQWHDLDIIRETIAVKGKDPVALNIYLTHHGPIINQVITDAGQAEPMALKWATLGENTLFSAILKLNQAQNWEQFRAALRDWRTPGQNVVYADVNGNIGYQMTSQVPTDRAVGSPCPAVGAWIATHRRSVFALHASTVLAGCRPGSVTVVVGMPTLGRDGIIWGSACRPAADGRPGKESGMPVHDIVVIGASAGGMEALQDLVRGVPPDLPAALFVVWHMPAHSVGSSPRCSRGPARCPPPMPAMVSPLNLGASMLRRRTGISCWNGGGCA